MASPEFAIVETGKALRIDYGDGTRRVLPANMLWEQCPSAVGRRRRFDGVRTTAPPGIAITAAEPVGLYGVNIAFSDGHDRGIYPWGYLAELPAPLTPDDFYFR